MTDTNDTREAMTEVMVLKIMRISNKRNRMDAMPMYFDDNQSVTTKEIHTIEAIGEHQQINITELAAYSGVTKSAVSQIIKKLVKRKLVDKRPAAHSNKEIQLSLTDLGWKAFHAHKQFHNDHMVYLMDQLKTFTLSQIASATVLLDNFEKTLDKAMAQLMPKQ